jgi:hypothetical protein
MLITSKEGRDIKYTRDSEKSGGKRSLEISNGKWADNDYTGLLHKETG